MGRLPHESTPPTPAAAPGWPQSTRKLPKNTVGKVVRGAGKERRRGGSKLEDTKVVVNWKHCLAPPAHCFLTLHLSLKVPNVLGSAHLVRAGLSTRSPPCRARCSSLLSPGTCDGNRHSSPGRRSRHGFAPQPPL